MQFVSGTVKRYIAVLITGAVTLLTVITTQDKRPTLTPGEILVAIGFVMLIALARRFPLRISTSRTIAADTGLIFATLLVIPMPWGPFVAGLGVLIDLLSSRYSLSDTVINADVTIVKVFSVQGIYLLLGGTVLPKFNDVSVIVPLVGAGLALLAVDRLLIAAQAAFDSSNDRWQIMFDSWGLSVKEKVALLLLGVYATVLYEVQPWALLMTAVPVVMIYLSMRNGVQKELELQTWDAVRSLADLIDRRDPYTAGHSSRVALLARQLALELGLTWHEVETIRAAAQAHDLGKIEIDASILCKPGPLNDDEWELMRCHPKSGADIVSRFPEFARGAEYVRYHHETLDGQGYPYGLSGTDIPVGAQIIAVADAFDAMTTDRPYRKALPMNVVLKELKRNAGTKWDKRIVAALLRTLEQRKIQKEDVGALAPAAA